MSACAHQITYADSMGTSTFSCALPEGHDGPHNTTWPTVAWTKANWPSATREVAPDA